MLPQITDWSQLREHALAPRVSVWPAWVGAALCTLATFLILPGLHWLGDRPAPTRPLRALRRVALPAPQPTQPPLRVVTPPRVPAPPLREVAEPMIERLPVVMQLSTMLSGVEPAMAVSFSMRDASDLGGIAQTVFDLAEVDVPPTPLVQLKPVYPPAARMRRLGGAVTLEFIVGIDGRTQSIEVVDAGQHAVFVKGAINAIRRWRFSPGTQRGNPVPVRVRQTVRFNLDGGVR